MNLSFPPCNGRQMWNRQKNTTQQQQIMVVIGFAWGGKSQTPSIGAIQKMMSKKERMKEKKQPMCRFLCQSRNNCTLNWFWWHESTMNGFRLLYYSIVGHMICMLRMKKLCRKLIKVMLLFFALALSHHSKQM